MDIHVSLHRPGHFSADVYGEIRRAIVDGRLRAGDALPATRDLATQLGVSRNTVLHAYERLAAEGFLVGRVGAGTFVSATAIAGTRRAPAHAPLRGREVFDALAKPRLPKEPAQFDFQVGAPDPRLFPWQEWRRLVGRELRRKTHEGGYPPPEGDPRLRAAIARHVGLARSVHAGADDVLVTSGAQQAFDLVARVLVPPGGCVALEDPGYPPVRRAFLAHGAEIVPVKVDGEGIAVDALPPRARVVYVTPSHQFPLGSPMSLARRSALLAWAGRRNAAIVEDDYDTEFRWGGRPLESLQSLDRAGRVLYIGTYSKVLLPTLRIGFVVAPPSILRSLRVAKELADSHGAVEPQRALAALLDDGTFTRHTRRLARVYGERRRVLLAAIARSLGNRVAIVPSSAGLHVTVLFRDRKLDEAEVVTRSAALGVRVDPLRPYFAGRPRAGLALGFGMIDESRIGEGIRRLALAAP